MGHRPVLRNIFWDLGGTLIDTYPATVAAFLETLVEFGVCVEAADARALFRTSTDHALRVVAGRYGLDLDRLRACYRGRAGAIPAAQLVPFPGVRAVLRRVRDVGGVNLLVTHRLRAGVVALLEAHGLDRWIDDLVAGDDGWPRKPDPKSLVDLAERHSLDRAECLVIGDRPLDIEAGRRAGIRTCLFGDAADDGGADLRIRHHEVLLAHLAAAP